MSNKVIMYKTAICPYCTKAKQLLKRKNLTDIQEIDISSDPELILEMMQKTSGRRTVPQIFINDNYIGGCDDLYALEEKGELDKIIK